MSKVFFKEMGLPESNYSLGINQIEHGQMINYMFKGINEILFKGNFDGVLVYGDTNTTLAGSLSAQKYNLPIFHVESGLRSFDRLMIEENNRIIVDHISSLLFCPTIRAVKNLEKENLKNGVKLSGDVMYDAYIKFGKITNHKFSYKSPFILATVHRRENITSVKKLTLIFENLDKIAKKINIIMPLHPHTQKILKKNKINTNIRIIDPVGYLGMIELLKKCKMVITDSGGLQKEAYFAGKLAMLMLPSGPWPDLISSNWLSLGGWIDEGKMLENFIKMRNRSLPSEAPNFFGDGAAAKIIVDHLSRENFV